MCIKRIVLYFLVAIFSITSLSAQEVDTSISKKKNFIHSVYIPAAFFLAGFAAEIKMPRSIDNTVFTERNRHNQNFKTSVDDYFQYSPVLLTYAFNAMGMKCKTDIGNRTAIALKSQILMTAVVTVMKNVIHETRPDGTEKSFPSGHTAEAFVAASFMSEELGERYKWTPYLAYSIASSVGILRVMNNKHYVSDVLIGAGIGILTTKVIYATHKYHWGKRKQVASQI